MAKKKAYMSIILDYPHVRLFLFSLGQEYFVSRLRACAQQRMMDRTYQ